MAPVPVEADIAVDVEGDAGEEMQQPRVKMVPKTVSKADEEAHYATGHAVFRSWCRHCVDSRGLGDQHRRSPKEEKETGLPTIHADYGFMADGASEESLPILVLRDGTTRGYGATAVPRKGVDKYSIAFYAGFVKELGWRRYVSKSENEPALLALKGAVSTVLKDVEMVPKESPVGDHAANGEAERAVREIKGVIRALKSSLEHRLGRTLPASHPILTWMPRHAAECLSRYKIGEDGRTAEQRRTGKKWRKLAPEFGERIHVKVASAQAEGSGFRPKMVEGRYVGSHSRTGMILAMTKVGVIRGRGHNRMTDADRWNPEGIDELVGVPWKLKGDSETLVARPLLAGSEAVPAVLEPARAVEEQVLRDNGFDRKVEPNRWVHRLYQHGVGQEGWCTALGGVHSENPEIAGRR